MTRQQARYAARQLAKRRRPFRARDRDWRSYYRPPEKMEGAGWVAR